MKKKLRLRKKKHSYIFVALLLLFLVILAYKTTNHFGFEEKKIRKPAVAGSWYPGTRESITETLNNYYNNVRNVGIQNIRAIIVPHAGWRFSGQVASTAFKQIEGRQYNTVIIIGPSHTASFSGASIPDVTHYETPLGLVKVSQKAKKLLEEPLFISHETAHIREHDIEIELPFLQKSLGDFEIIPILIGPLTSYEEIKKIAKTLKKYIDEDTLIVVSSDFTHYGPNYGYVPFTENVSDNIKRLDFMAINEIAGLDSDGFYNYLQKTGATICGRLPILVLLNLLPNKTEAKLLFYDTSGRILGDYKNSVSYVSMVFYEAQLTKEEQDFLLKLARKTLEMYLKEGAIPIIDESKLTTNLKKVQGCFVTLTKHGRLRGCIGDIWPMRELYKCVIGNAVNAAVNDIRFNPVSYDELKDIEIEISVLSPPAPLEFSSSDDLLKKLRPRVDGVVITYNGRRSTYLPQVWDNFGTKEQFLSSLCRKQGSISDCWKKKNVKIDTYQAFVFHES